MAQRARLCYTGKCEQSCVGVEPAVSSAIVVELPSAEQARWQQELRSHLRGRLLAVHVLRLLTMGLSPSVVAQALFCSLGTVHRSRTRWLQQTGPFAPTPNDSSGPVAACPLAYP